MKAVYFAEYGSIDQLEVKDLPKPEPKEDEVLVKNHASSLNFGNYGHIVGKPFFIRAFTGFGKTKYNTPGGDVAGVVKAVGSQVTEFKPGDEVMGDTADTGFGAYAEYVTVPEKVLVPKPANLSFNEAATLPLASAVALGGLKKGNIQAGRKVLLVGSTGSVGPFAVQIAKALGAEVTAVCAGKKMDFVRSLGADFVIDYKTEDFVKKEKKFDLVISIAGFRKLSDYKSVLSLNGIYVSIGGNMKSFSQAIALGPIYSMFGKQTFISYMYRANKQALMEIKELAEAGKIKAVIDKTFPLDQIVDAFKFYESGQAAGKIVIAIQ